MKRIDRLLVAVGCGLFVAGWVTRHADLALVGGAILAGYALIRMIAGEPL